MALLDNYGMFDYAQGDSDVYEYTSDEFSTLIAALTGTGVSRNDGNELACTASGLTITIDTGSCFIGGRWGSIVSPKTLTLDATSATATRYDTIAVVLDTANRTMSVEALKGEATANVFNSSSLFYLPLCEAKISGGSNVVLTDKRVYTYSATALQSELNAITTILTDALPISRGGTGATTASAARKALAAASATHTHGLINNDGTISGAEPGSVLVAGNGGIVQACDTETLQGMMPTLSITAGGTGATTAAGAVANLGYASNMVVYSATEPTVVNGKIWLKPVEA